MPQWPAAPAPMPAPCWPAACRPAIRPNSWQAHAGQEIIGTYVAANQIMPLDDLFEREGWLDVMPETLIPLISAGRQHLLGAGEHSPLQRDVVQPDGAGRAGVTVPDDLGRVLRGLRDDQGGWQDLPGPGRAVDRHAPDGSCAARRAGRGRLQRAVGRNG